MIPFISIEKREINSTFVDSLSPKQEAFENCALGMFGYMTDLGTVEELSEETIEVEAENIDTLLYKFLDEFLFLFSAEPFFIARRVKITEIDLENFKIKAKGYGETFDLDKHPQVRFHIVCMRPCVIQEFSVKIWLKLKFTSPVPNSEIFLLQLQGTEVKAITFSNMQIHDKEVFVIIDI